jgi:hypothetical protein
MLKLPNNCRCTGINGDSKKCIPDELPVFPRNWKTVRANPRITWYISYRFYDDNLNQSQKVIIKGFNEYKTLKAKQDAVRTLMDYELDLLKNKGYNKITKSYYVDPSGDVEISDHTPFLEALNYSYDNLKLPGTSKIDIKSCLKYISQAAELLRYDRIPLKDIKVKHIILVLEKTGQIKKKLLEEKRKLHPLKKYPDAWTANTFNYYRTSLGILFKPLVKLQIKEFNIAYMVEKEKKIVKIRETLSTEERKIVDAHVYQLDYKFWRFMHLFFHSGSRIVEMLAIRKTEKQIDFENLRFKITVKKGKKFQEEWRPIKEMIVDLWKEVYNESKQGQYLFSEGLNPGDKMIRREQVTRRWRRHVKKKLGITADFYSLKHSNLDDIAKMAGLAIAQEAGGHATPVITIKYATGEPQRKFDAIKELKNSFA